MSFKDELRKITEDAKIKAVQMDPGALTGVEWDRFLEWVKAGCKDIAGQGLGEYCFDTRYFSRDDPSQPPPLIIGLLLTKLHRELPGCLVYQGPSATSFIVCWQ